MTIMISTVSKTKEGGSLARDGIFRDCLLRAAEFNRKLKARGIGILNTIRRTFGEWVLGRDAGMVSVPSDRESSHFLTMGDSSTGRPFFLFS